MSQEIYSVNDICQMTGFNGRYIRSVASKLDLKRASVSAPGYHFHKEEVDKLMDWYKTRPKRRNRHIDEKTEVEKLQDEIARLRGIINNLALSFPWVSSER
jgi:hypothetical protein